MVSSTGNGLAAPRQLRCEYQLNPLGIDETRPHLSWLVTDDRQGAVQSAYQVVVRNEAGDTVWDSGKIASDQSVHVEYSGASLLSRMHCLWQVRTWDAHGTASPWSEAAWWEMGLLQRGNWQASWVHQPADQVKPLDQDHEAVMASPLLRRTFTLPEPPRRARAYATARGVYELRINGQRVGKDLFAPGWTDYSQRVRYQTYDITELLRQGDNTIGAILGTGWYCGHIAGWKKTYGDRPQLLVQLEIETDDSQIVAITSDEAWKVATGPVLGSDMLMGETYDARLEIPGWDQIGFDDTTWSPVEVVALCDDGPALEAPLGTRVRKITEITPRKITEPTPGVYVFDLGQNLVGHVRLKIKGEAGQIVTLRFAEVLNPDGTIYTENLRHAKATDHYILRGDKGGETWEPRFTFHGFRYVEVTGLKQTPALDLITGVVVHSDMPQTGSFECSHELLNQLQHNIEWGQRGNYLEVPTDCPQRDERLGWMGDAQVFAPTGCFNFEIAAFMGKWMTDVADAQRADGCFTDFAPDQKPALPKQDPPARRGSPAWADAGVIVPWTIYQRYGDKRILEHHYDTMARYIDFVACESEDRIGPDFGYGDWLNHFAFTPLDLIATAFNAHSTDLMCRIAKVLGRDDDVQRFTALLGEIKAAFNRRFVTPDGRLVGDTQTAYILALRFNLLPQALRRKAVSRLVYDVHHGRSAEWPYHERKGHVSCGFVGVSYINDALTDAGHLDLAYQLLLNEDYPSWLFPVKHGATTIWERWDGWTPDRGFQDPNMNSFNHYAYGAIGQWLYETVAGIRPAQPGYKRIVIHPRPGGGLTYAKASYQSLYGLIESGWRLDGETFTLEVTIPPNTTATVTAPDGQRHEVGAGRHTFHSEHV